MISLSTMEARRFLLAYHFSPGTIGEVFERLGTVQYDPLNPVGRNSDLVLQARISDYRVDDWQQYAYRQRLAYDAWDKQACLVPTSTWAERALIRERYHPWHDRDILDAFPDLMAVALREIDVRGPLCSLDFADRTRAPEGHSWYGPTRIKRILRALWARGVLVTHHRDGVRHYYDRPERVIPGEHFCREPLLDESAYHRWIVLQRHRATGFMRPRADLAIWSVCGDAPTRANAIAALVRDGELIPVEVGERKSLFHMPAESEPLLNAPPAAPVMRFLAPLDNLIWDRNALRDVFGFDYVWEVYKRSPDRVWGYYVLPVMFGDRFVGRFDSRVENGVWMVTRWWWEDGEPQADVLHALPDAASRFLFYLGATTIGAGEGVDAITREALRLAE
ncbi:MAG TPA: crosslink repair DNA glycosylase YcaQ family protein [Chloroflexota bacterium]